jgi:TatD DNase family protein
VIDIGVNLLHDQFADDREQVLARAAAAAVTHVVITGTDLPTSAAAADYVARRAVSVPALFCTAGVHPHHASEVAGDWLARLRALAAHPAVRAIGETGLDFHRNFSPPEVQEQVFRAQLDLAGELQMPVFVHDREAGRQVASHLQDAAVPPGDVVVHCFTGSARDLERYLALGCWIGITGWVCDRRRGETLRGLVPEIPTDRLLVETDAPFLRPHDAPRDRHGRRNEPALLSYVVRRLAELYGMDEADLAGITAANARRFFRLPG